MQCNDVRKRLGAWIDNELSSSESDEVANHLNQCRVCRLEAEELKQLTAALDALPVIQAPHGFSRRAVRAFRAEFNVPGMMEWWRSLSLAMRGAVCGAALAGLLCGAILGTSIAIPGGDAQANPYQTLYAGKGILP